MTMMTGTSGGTTVPVGMQEWEENKQTRDLAVEVVDENRREAVSVRS